MILRPRWLRSAGRLRSAAVALLVAVPLLVAVLSGKGAAQQRVAMSGGGAWLASPAQGVVTLIDGPSDQVVATVRLAAASPVSVTSVTQAGTSAYVVDGDAGSVSRVDGSTYQVSAPVGFGVAGGAVSVFPGTTSTYVVDGARRLASVTDPRTLAVRSTLSLTARPGIGQSVVDDAGRLWVLDGETGELVWFDHGAEHRRRGVGTGASAVPGRPADQLLLVKGRAVLADPAQARVGTLTGDGRVHGWSCLGVRSSDQTQLLGSATSEQVYAAVKDTGTLVVAQLGGSGDDCTEAVPVGSPGADFGALVQVGGYVLVPNRTTGKTVIVDVGERRVADEFSVVQAGHPLELLAKDGLVFYNDPSSDRAGVIHFDGRTWTLGQSLQKFRLGKGGRPITNELGGSGGATSSPLAVNPSPVTTVAPTGPVAPTSGVPLPLPPTRSPPTATGSIPATSGVPGTPVPSGTGPPTSSPSTGPTPTPTQTPTVTGNPDCGGGGGGGGNRGVSGQVAGGSTQKIVFPVIAPHVWPNHSVTVAACSTSGLPVTLTLDTASFCALNGTTLTSTLPTSCQVTASQPGDATFAPATPVSRTLSVGQQRSTLSWVVGPPAEAPIASSLTLKVKASSPSGPVADTSIEVFVKESSSDICSGPGTAQLVNEKATFTLTIIDPGTCTVVVHGPSGDDRTTQWVSTEDRSFDVVIPVETTDPTTPPPSKPPATTTKPPPAPSQTPTPGP